MRILVVEDERDLAEVIAALLEVHHYSVEVVDNGDDTLFYLEQSQYDALILDVMLPGADGYSIAKELRRRKMTLPILMLTAKSQLEDKVTGLEMGADDYLTKPFEAAELIARVKSLLRRPALYVANHLTYGNITLNRSDYQLQVAEQKLDLNNKEFQLLEYFLLNTKQVLSTDTIMEKVWGLDSDAEVNVVWVNISSLRKKFQQLGANVTILSKRGLGYQLVENKENGND